jgi:hypothetical protein
MRIDMKIKSEAAIKVADEVWIATALLQRENPDRADFTMEEIRNHVQRESLVTPIRPGVYVHIDQHCVANRPPNPGRYRMLLETAPGRRRLFRKGDPYHPKREGSKVTPNPQDLPSEYLGLLAWYRDWSSGAASAAPGNDPLLLLAGSGKQLWSVEHAEEYVNRLREGWE